MKLARIFLDILFPPRENEQLVRALSYEELQTHLSPIYVQPNVVALLPYRNSQVSALIQEAKFRDNLRAQELLGHLLADYIQKEGLQEALIIPIPLSPERLRSRGYNQIERILAAANIAYESSVLVRTRNTAPQTSLGAQERRTNLRNAFLTQGVLISNKTYIVLDDVTTTGATLFSAMEALKSAGAHEVRAITLAH